MHDDEFIRMIRPHALGQIATFRQTMTACRDVVVRNVPGDFVECGVYKGAEVAIMLREARPSPPRLVHMFDCFTGIPEPDENDAADIRACLTDEHGKFKPGVSACSLPQVMEYLAEWVGPAHQYAVAHVGMFEDVLPELDTDKVFPFGIAVLRLDGDLYRSTKVCLEVLEPLVNEGGCVIVDDFNVVGCRQAVDEYLEEKGLLPDIIPIEGSDGPAFWVKK